MHLVERSKQLLLATGSEWVLWILVGLSAASFAVIVERVIALRKLRGDTDDLRAVLASALREGGFARARDAMGLLVHPAARVALRGMRAAETETDPKEAEGAMSAETLAQKRGLERRFGFLATLGANAPFIGLFGTVIGILQAFDALGHQGSSAAPPTQVMSSIAEALVATAVGLGVAIPAVVAFNAFSRTVREALDDAHVLSLDVLAHLDGVRARSSKPDLRVVSTRAGGAS
jgi:biopolymer transport protein ExbB